MGADVLLSEVEFIEGDDSAGEDLDDNEVEEAGE
jgi:hypothetical protein